MMDTDSLGLRKQFRRDSSVVTTNTVRSHYLFCSCTVITHLMWWSVMATSQSGWADGFNLGLRLELCWCFSPLARPGDSYFYGFLLSGGRLCFLFILNFSSKWKLVFPRWKKLSLDISPLLFILDESLSELWKYRGWHIQALGTLSGNWNLALLRTWWKKQSS